MSKSTNSAAEKLASKSRTTLAAIAYLRKCPPGQMTLENFSQVYGYRFTHIRGNLAADGLSFKKLVSHERKRRLKLVMAEGTPKVSTAATALGFKSTEGFNYWFKKEFGKSWKSSTKGAIFRDNLIRPAGGAGSNARS